MSLKSPKASREKPPQNNYYIPVLKTDLSVFDDTYSKKKEQFAAKMKRIDNEMSKFSKKLIHLYGQTTTVQTEVISPTKELSLTDWETITKSPLVQGEGKSKMLMLQFDVSQFEPSEVNVKIHNDQLIVSAYHKKKSDGSSITREYKREMFLPKGIDLKAVISSMSHDGILTVQTPFPKFMGLEGSCLCGDEVMVILDLNLPRTFKMSVKLIKDKTLQNCYYIPIQKTDSTIFDTKLSKEQFAAEMRRIDNEMTEFSKEVLRLYGLSTSVRELSSADWETITKSPLVQGEGKSKMLVLQFDVTQFEPSEVKVKIQNEHLIVSAYHKNNFNGSSVTREYKREMILPKGINFKGIIASMSHDGILTVQTPFPKFMVLESLYRDNVGSYWEF